MNTSGADSIMQTLISDMSLRVSNFDITNIDKIIDALYLVKSTGWETVSSAFASSSDVVNAIATYSPQIIKMNSIVGGLTISDPPVIFSNGLTGIFPGILIPLLAAASQWVQMKVSTKNQKIDLDTQMGSTMNTMNMMMPLMSLFFCTTLPAGIGIGESANEQLAYEKADQNARVDLAKSIDAQTKALIKNFKEEVSDEIAEHFQSTSKTAVDQRLNGATLNDVKVETTADGKFKVYGVMTLDSDLVSEYIKMLEQQEKKEEAEKIRAAAEKAYAELDEMD